MIVTLIAASAFLFLPSSAAKSHEKDPVKALPVNADSDVLLEADSEGAQGSSDQAAETPAVVNHSLRDSWKEYRRLLLDRRMQRLIFNFANSGMIVALYTGFFFTIITSSIDSQDESEINRYTAYVFVVLGAFECIAGLVVGKLADMMNKAQALKYSGFIVELAYVVTLIAYFEKKYYLCLIAGAFWGFCDCMTQTLSTTLIGTEFKGQLEAFGLFLLFQGLFGAFGLLILATDILKGEYFLYLMFGWQILVHVMLSGLKLTRPGSFSQAERDKMSGDSSKIEDE